MEQKKDTHENEIIQRGLNLLLLLLFSCVLGMVQSSGNRAVRDTDTKDMDLMQGIRWADIV